MLALHRLDGVAVLQLLGFHPGDGGLVLVKEFFHRGLERGHGGAGRRQLALHFQQLRLVGGLLLIPLQLLGRDLFFFLLLEAVVKGLLLRHLPL